MPTPRISAADSVYANMRFSLSISGDVAAPPRSSSTPRLMDEQYQKMIEKSTETRSNGQVSVEILTWKLHIPKTASRVGIFRRGFLSIRQFNQPRFYRFFGFCPCPLLNLLSRSCCPVFRSGFCWVIKRLPPFGST